MKKRILPLLLAAAFAVTAPVTPARAAEPSVFIMLDGLLQKTSIPPVTRDGQLCVSFREFSDILGGSIVWDGAANAAAMTAPGRKALLRVGDKKMTINYREVVAPVAPFIAGGNLMAPFAFLCEQFGLSLEWENGRSIAHLSGGGSEHSVYDVKRAANAQPNAKAYTMKEAVAAILAASSSLKDLRDSLIPLGRRLSDAEDWLKDYKRPDLRDQYGFLLDWGDRYPADYVEKLQTRHQLSNQIEAVGLNEKLLRASAELRLVNALLDIERTDLDVYLLEEKIRLDEMDLANTRLKASLGLASANQVASIENGITRGNANLDALNLKQTGNRLALTNLLGLKAGTAVRVTDFDPADAAYNANVDAFIASLQKTAPGVALKEIDQSNAAYVRYTYEDILYEPYQEQKKNGQTTLTELDMANRVASAKRAVEDEKTKIDKNARNALQTIRQTEQNAAGLAVDHDNARRAYNTAVTNYVAGYATYYDVQQAQLGMFNAEASVVANGLNLRAAVEAYRKADL